MKKAQLLSSLLLATALSVSSTVFATSSVATEKKQ